MDNNIINKAIMGIISLVVLFYVYSALIPEAQTAGNALNASGAPLGSFFVSGGVVFIIIMVALVTVVIKGFMPKK